MRTVEVSPRAAREIEHADDWWWEHRPKAPGAVADEIRAAFERIGAQPESAPVIASHGIRRTYLQRIRYYLYYRIRNDGVVDVLSLWHANRGEDPEL